MKRFWWTLFGLCGVVVTACAQTTLLPVATDKTTSLVFPFPVIHVDIGTGDIMVQQVAQASHILLVKGAKKDFTPTTLSVIAADGSVYLFNARYRGNPDTMVYQLPEQQTISIAHYAQELRGRRRTTGHLKSYNAGMYLRLLGIYIQDDILYFQLQVENGTALPYETDVARFYIEDKRTAKRTASQQVDWSPIYTAGHWQHIRAFTNDIIVVAVKTFTIPDAKRFVIQLMEKNGGRHLTLHIKNGHLLAARGITSRR